MKLLVYLLFLFSFKGFLSTYWKVNTEGKARISWIQNTLNITAHQNIKDKTILYGEIEVDYLGFPGVEDFNDLLKQEKINPFRVVDKEIYVQFPALFGFIDLKMGDIIEKWGTADRFNPTDNINPYNLEDPIEFGESMPVPLIKVRIPFNDLFTLTGIYIPIFRPAQLPLSSLKAGIEATPLPPELVKWAESPLGEYAKELIPLIEKKPEIPGTSLRNSAFAIKVSTLLYGFDLSASFYHGREDMPLPVTGTIYINEKKGTVFLKYPEINAFGFDTSTSLPYIDLGLWFEGCIFFPS